MTTFERAWADTDREEGSLERVEGPHDGYYTVTSSNGWSCGVSAEYGVEPRVGDVFVTWGSIGRPIRGQAVQGRVLFYRTEDEQHVEDQKQAAKMRAERIAEYEGKRSACDARVAALPDPLRERIEGFRAFKGDAWRWEFEEYELMCCEQAEKMAEHFKTAEAVRAFWTMDWESQRAAFPALDGGHSGNSFGASCMLACALLERPETLSRLHGALCGLVGCESYGCYAARIRDVEGAES